MLPAHVSVWATIRQLELEDGDAAGVTEVYNLPVEAIEAALVYYQRHKRVIDARIQQNRAFFRVLAPMAAFFFDNDAAFKRVRWALANAMNELATAA